MTSRPTALVTGASRGIGKASALALAEAGFDVAVAARTVHAGQGRDDSDSGGDRVIPGSLAETAAEVEARGGRALAVQADLLDRRSLLAALETVIAAWGRLDVLVSNAVYTGHGTMVRFLDLPIETFETILAANVVNQFALMQAVIPHMARAGGGAIINLTSHVAENDPPAPAGEGGWGLGYAASKGAFHRAAGIIALEHAADGITAINVEPGFVVTERMEQNQGDLGLEGRYQGAPPSAPASVVAWLAAHPEAREEFNGQTVRALKVALHRGLHPDWRRQP